ncbi:MAG: 5-formyltetrahydrofolate cyclo-ligase [Campylobacterales bacterium]|nr:5-formyltetrahydrofolate cyclo-ligase [Campylobacterales bacterium]
MPLSKNEFRQNSLNTIKNLPKHNSFYLNAKLQKYLLKLLKQHGKTKRTKILFYYPLNFEADIRKLMKHLRSSCEIYLPFMEGESFKMVPFRLPLKKKKFDIFEAGNTYRKIKKIDIAIVPAVGVDGNLQRVGFGKGMYDRFFATLQERPIIIFTQPKLCYTQESLCDVHDIDCNFLVTPAGLVTNRAKVKKIGN